MFWHNAAFTWGRRKATFALLFLAALVLAPPTSPQARADVFNLGTALDYGLLFQGGGHNTLQITNVFVKGNVGVGNTGLATDSGPSSIVGRIDFSAADSGQFSNNNNSNVITGGVHYNVSAVASALTSINTLSQTLIGLAGTHVAINGIQTVNASSGATFTVNGQTVHVFDVTSFNNNGTSDVLTINGSASDLVAFNLDGLGNIQFHGGIAFTGGIGPDNVVFNVGGGNYSTLSGGPALDINNNGGAAGIAQGIFLDPNGAISVVHADVLGRVFGGDSHDFQYVSGANLTAPEETPPVPEPATMALALSGLASFGVLGLRRLRRRQAAAIV
jgi:hypothetical protein